MCKCIIIVLILFICGAIIAVIWGGIYESIKTNAIETARYCFNNGNLTNIEIPRCEYLLELKEDDELEGFELIYVWTWKDTFRKEIHCLNYDPLTSDDSFTEKLVDYAKYEHNCK